MNIDSRMVTLVTQCSMDRFPQLKEQALAYANAPISVALYIPFDRSEVTLNAPEDSKALQRIRLFHQELAAEGARRVTISLLFGNASSKRAHDDLYPVNALRNVALEAAKTDLVFLSDVDFVPSPKLAILNGGLAFDTFFSVCKCGAVLVVPAFEAVGSQKDLPKTQAELARQWHDKRVRGFQVIPGRMTSSEGHSPTNFTRWFTSDTPYLIKYKWRFEPYIIALKQTLPSYDERFKGYGGNKISHLYEVAHRGAHFIVLPDVFIIARQHSDSTSKKAWKETNGVQERKLMLSKFKDDVHKRWSITHFNLFGSGSRACHTTLSSFARGLDDSIPARASCTSVCACARIAHGLHTLAHIYIQT